MGELLWGAHICVFYETKEDLLNTAVSSFEAVIAARQETQHAVYVGVSSKIVSGSPAATMSVAHQGGSAKVPSP
jgi:hypothetical protein